MPPFRDLYQESYSGRPPPRSLIWATLLILCCLGLMVSLFVGGEYVQRYTRYTDARKNQNHTVMHHLRDPAKHIALRGIAEFPPPGFASGLLQSGLPVYDLRIASKEMKALQSAARRVTAKVTSSGVLREYQPAQFLRQGHWQPIDVKLRGDNNLHYVLMRPSMRLKFPKNDLFEGKRQINITDPYDKGLTADVTTNWELQRYGILTWDSRFVVLRVNDEVIGVFQEIEQFGRSISDRNLRPEGFIFSGDGQFYGDEGSGYEKAARAMELVGQCNRAGGAEPPSHCDWNFFNAHFETDRWAWAAAIKTLLGSQHGWFADNLRLFWDPAYGQFEPIPWDYSAYILDPHANPDGDHVGDTLGETLLGISEFRRMRDRRLWTLLEERIGPMKAHAEELYAKLEPALIADTRKLGIENDRELHANYLRALDVNGEFLWRLFRQHDLRMTVWGADDGVPVIEWTNHGKAFLTLAALIWERDEGRFQTALAGPLNTLDGVWNAQPGRLRLRVVAPPAARLVGVVASNGVTGDPLAEGNVRVEAGSGARPTPDIPPTPEPFVFELAGVQREANRIVFGPGSVTLEEVIEIPRRFHVVFAPGLSLAMGEGASLLISGDFTSVGTAVAPIAIFGKNGADWGAIAVQGTPTEPRRVHIAHTNFDGGTGAENDRTIFSGSLAVHGGLVRIEESTFRNGRAIDGINLKYSEVELIGNLFENSADDMLDCDFCNGRIVDNQIFDSGGDGLDFSGSKLQVDGNSVTRCADKGISVGERTTCEISNLEVTNCYTGVAVKDLSNASIMDSHFRNLEVGIALYIKKPTFGPSVASLENVRLENVATRVVRDESCRLIE